MTTVPFGQHICWCGKPYAATADGRWTHRTLFAHTPSDGPTEPPAPEPQGLCRACRGAQRSSDAQHCHGDGGPILGDVAVPCGCRCASQGWV